MTERHEITYAYHGQKVISCRGCGQKIFFERMESGKFMPVTKDTGRPHWGECENANDFKTPKEPQADLELGEKRQPKSKARGKRKSHLWPHYELYRTKREEKE